MSESTLKEAKEKFCSFSRRANSSGITNLDLLNISLLGELRGKQYEHTTSLNACKFMIVTLSVLSLLLTSTFTLIWAFEWPVTKFDILNACFSSLEMDIAEEMCIIPNHDVFQHVLRKPLDCAFCKDISNVAKVSNLRQQIFIDKFAYSGRPVIIEDATADWTASAVFNFQFFKELYSENNLLLHQTTPSCQFFPYKTNFGSLADLFNSSYADPNHTNSKPWYVGW